MASAQDEYGIMILEGLRDLIATALKDSEAALGLDDLFDGAATVVSEITAGVMKSQPPTRPIACDDECAWCCHQYEVAVSGLEALRIASHIDQTFSPVEKKDLLNRLTAVEAEKARHPPSERPLALFACPLLKDATCSIYAVRPMVCRGVNSASAADCERTYRTKGESSFGTNYKPQGLIAQLAAKALELAAADALLDARKLDLAPALRIALTTPGARDRWLRKKFTFKDARSRLGAKFANPLTGKT